jgi:hypothetical protein
MKKRLAIIAAAVLIAAVLAGCGSAIKESDLSYASPMVDSLLSAVQAKDYAKFSTDLGDKMKASMTEDNFTAMADALAEKIGDFESKSFAGASNTTQDNTPYTAIVYKAKYSKEQGDVIVTVSFTDKDGKKVIEGLNFNSPNLRKQ